MALMKTVKTDDYGNFIVSSMTDGTVAGRRMFYTTYGAVDPTIFKLINSVTNIVGKCNLKTGVAQNQYYNLFSDFDPNNASVATWKDKLDSCCVWLYGSLDDGGILLAKSNAADSYYFMGINGQYRNNSNNKLQYRIAFSYSLNFSKDYEVVFNYLYNPQEQYQNVCKMMVYPTESDLLTHYNALWVGVTSPSWVDLGRVDTLLYLKNGGFQTGIPDGIHYPNSCIGAYTSGAVTKEFYDDAINEVLTSTHTHVSGTLFSGVIHTDPNDGGGSGGQQGGSGNYDNSQDGQNPVKQNLKGCLDTGILTLYNPSVTDMQNFAAFLYSSLTDGDAIALKKLFASPMDYIICFNMTHLDLSLNIADTKTVHFGGVDTTIAMPYLENQFVYASGGSLSVPHQCNNFLDYSPYTKAKLYIPYCGEYDLPIDLVTAGTMYIDYMIDLLSGAVTAQLSITRDRHGLFNTNMNIEDAANDLYMTSFQGNIYTQIPIGSIDNRGLVSSLLGIAAATGTAIATSNPLPLMGSVANTALSSKETITKSGSISSCYGYIAPQYAQIILQRPIQNKPSEFSLYRGYPSNTINKISHYKEFVTIDPNTFWTDNFSKPITNEETQELKQILNDGFYIPV